MNSRVGLSLGMFHDHYLQLRVRMQFHPDHHSCLVGPNIEHASHYHTFILAYGLLLAIDLRMVILDYGPLFVVGSPFKHTFEVIDIHERKDSDVDY